LVIDAKTARMLPRLKKPIAWEDMIVPGHVTAIGAVFTNITNFVVNGLTNPRFGASGTRGLAGHSTCP
jgi:hypothetical protein